MLHVRQSAADVEFNTRLGSRDRMIDKKENVGRWGRTPLIPALGKQRQADLCEFKASPGLQSEFQDSQGCYTEKLCLEKTKTNKQQRKRRKEQKDRVGKCTLKIPDRTNFSACLGKGDLKLTASVLLPNYTHMY